MLYYDHAITHDRINIHRHVHMWACVCGQRGAGTHKGRGESENHTHARTQPQQGRDCERDGRSTSAAAAGDEPCRCHVVAVPFPGRGHVNAMMNLSRLLAARGAATVTFVVTEEWLGLLSSSSAPPGVRLRAIPNVIPSENGRAADHAGFLDAVGARMEAPFERLLDRLRLEEEEETAAPVAAFVADFYVPWVVDVGNRRGVPVCSLFPMAAVFFSAYYHFDSLPSWLAKPPHQPVAGATTGEVSSLLPLPVTVKLTLS